MRFFQRFDEYSTLTGSPVAGTPTDSALAEDADYWNGSWYFAMTGSPALDVRKVDDFVAGGSLTLNRSLSSNPAAGDRYQLLDYNLSPHMLHDAINKAITESIPYFFQVRLSEDLILQEDTLEYSLSSISPTVWKIKQVWLEQAQSVKRGVVVSTTGTITTIDSSDTGDVDSSWLLSIYDGTGKGQQRAVTSVSGAAITHAVWTTNPDTTSKYALWDPTEQTADWYDLPALRVDRREWPDEIHFPNRYVSEWGHRIRIQYLAQPQALTTEAGTTIVPTEYVVLKALSIIYMQLSNSNRADRQHLRQQATDYEAMAIAYAMKNAFAQPAETLWMESDLGAPRAGYSEDHNPLGWG